MERPRQSGASASLGYGQGDSFRWLARYPDFRDQYWIAKEWLMDAMMDEIMEIADDSSRDTPIHF
jgi:hypothetical protein